MNRDKTLDCLRGFAMLQVVFVHAMYWLYSIKPTVARSFLLFEMLVFFFVTGAVNSMKEHRSYGEFCLKRIKGLMIPYYIYAAICMVIAAVCYRNAGEFTPALAFRMVLSWLVPLNTQMIPLWFYPWALWFVPVYLLGILLFPPIRKAVRRFGWMAIAGMVLLFVAVEIVLPLAVRNVPGEGGGLYVHRLSDILQETVFYSVFMAAGALHSRLKLREKRDGLLALAILVLSVAGLWISSSVFGRTLDMQENKFPPNHVFLFYASAVMTLLYLALPVLKTLYRLLVRAVPPVDKWIALFSANSMTVFLYQPFAFWGTYLLLRRYGLRKTAWEPYAAILLLYLLVWLIILLANLLKAARNVLARRLAG